MNGCGCQACGSDSPAARPDRAAYRIQAMDCPTEEALIRAKLGGLPGIRSLEFNLLDRTLYVDHGLASLEPVEQALAAIGMQGVRVGAEAPAPPAPAHAAWIPLAIAGTAALGAEIASWLGTERSWPVLALALAAILTGGFTTYRKGWTALRNRQLNMNALMSIAVTGAMLIGHWPEAAMVMVLFALAERIEAKSLDRTRRAVRDLLALAPDRALVRQPDGAWADQEARHVPLGSRVRVRPGERIALDGQVVEGASSVDQAPITGESLPVDKGVGDLVFAGTINQSGALEYRVTAPADQSTLARIIHAVEAAEASRAPTQRFVDQFARWYTPAVFALALGVALAPPLALGAPWLAWTYRALVLLVIACPCALVISTPVTIVSGLAAAARHGILIKGGAYLEEGRKLRWLALDKTGTLTHGAPVQTDASAWGDADPERSRVAAASLASLSDHPVSRALALAARNEGIPLEAVDEFTALPGRGVQGRVGGRTFLLGNHRMVEEQGVCSPGLEARLDALEVQGKTVVILVGAAGPLALFAVADTLRKGSREAVAELHALGVRTLMLTGDNGHTAQAIAAQAGIDEARGNLLPEEKLGVIERLAQAGPIGMVGDGINDAPALARAHIGIAMGAAGSDAAIEAADVALMDDDLRKVPAFIRLSRATGRILRQNIVLALAIKFAFLLLTFAGRATMWMAVFADMGASLLVVFNGLRLLRYPVRPESPRLP